MTRFYRWYDRLRDPWRMLFALFISMIGLVTFNLAIDANNWKLALVSLTYLMVLLASRVYYVEIARSRNSPSS